MSDSITQGLAANVLRLGNEVRDLSISNAVLRDDNARLKAEVERLTEFATRTIIPNDELQAQVERLTADIEQLQNRCDFLEGNQP